MKVEQLSEGDLTQKSAAKVISARSSMQMRDRVLLRLPGLKPSHDPRTQLEGGAQITKLYG